MAGTISIASRGIVQNEAGLKTEKITVSWVGDAANGSVPVLSIPKMHGTLVKVVINPGSTAPTDNYDIILGDPDDNALDACNGLLLDRDTANTEQVYPMISSSRVFLCGTYALTITNNIVNSATGDIHFYINMNA